MRTSTSLVVVAAAIVALSDSVARGELLPEYGVKAGLNLANVAHDDLDSSSRTNFVGGLYVDVGGIGITNLHVQAEALWSTKGFKDGTFTVDGESYSADLRNTYFQFPLLLAYYFPPPGSIDPRLYAGPTFNVLGTAEIKDSETNDWVDIKDFQKEITWGLVVGGAVRLSEIDLIVRYEWGLSSLGDFGDRAPAGIADEEAKDRVFTVMIGFPFSRP